MQNIDQIKVGIAPIKWSQDTKQHPSYTSFIETISDIKKAKFDGCELSQHFPHDPYLLHSTLRPHGLKVSSAQFHSHFTVKEKFSESVNRFIDHMHFLNAVGAKRIIVCECAHNSFQSDHAMLEKQPKLKRDQWKLLIEGLNRIGKIANEAGMQVTYQPRIGTVIHTEKDIAKLMDKTDANNVSLLIDTAHFNVLDINAVEILKTYPERVDYIYLKDVNKRILNKAIKQEYTYHQAKNAGLFVAPGDGSIKFDPLFKAIKAVDYKGWIIAQGVEVGDIKFSTYAKNTRKYMKTKLGI